MVWELGTPCFFMMIALYVDPSKVKETLVSPQVIPDGARQMTTVIDKTLMNVLLCDPKTHFMTDVARK